jgi:hypothetical protein
MADRAYWQKQLEEGRAGARRRDRAHRPQRRGEEAAGGARRAEAVGGRADRANEGGSYPWPWVGGRFLTSCADFVDLEAGQPKVLEDLRGEHLLGIVGNGLLKPWRPAGTCR